MGETEKEGWDGGKRTQCERCGERDEKMWAKLSMR